MARRGIPRLRRADGLAGLTAPVTVWTFMAKAVAVEAMNRPAITGVRRCSWCSPKALGFRRGAWRLWALPAR